MCNLCLQYYYYYYIERDTLHLLLLHTLWWLSLTSSPSLARSLARLNPILFILLISTFFIINNYLDDRLNWRRFQWIDGSLNASEMKAINLKFFLLLFRVQLHLKEFLINHKIAILLSFTILFLSHRGLLQSGKFLPLRLPLAWFFWISIEFRFSQSLKLILI